MLRADASALVSLVAVWWSFCGQRLFGHVNQSVGRRNRCAAFLPAPFPWTVVVERGWWWLVFPLGGCVHTLTGHQSLTSGMELRDNILVSGNADSTVRVWDVRTGHCLHTLQGTGSHIGQMFKMSKWLLLDSMDVCIQRGFNWKSDVRSQHVKSTHHLDQNLNIYTNKYINKQITKHNTPNSFYCTSSICSKIYCIMETMPSSVNLPELHVCHGNVLAWTGKWT